ncbi:MAG: hypothetical protein R3F62_19610 [Planctomycetota bacterium]
MRHLGLLALLSLAVAQADILHLHNGRTLEGQVVRRTPSTITLRMNHGRMNVPTDQVKEIERRMRPEHELAERYREIDPTNPAELERLALWASQRGLGREASDLSAHALGIRLERRMDAIRDSRDIRDWLDTYTWAQVNGCSETVQLHLLGQAQAIDPEDRTLRALIAAREEAARAAARRQAEIERRRDEPIFKMPDRRAGLVIRGGRATPVVDEVAQERAREARVAELGSVPAGSPTAPVSAEEARIAELEQRIAEQERREIERAEEQAELESELERLRQRRRFGRRVANPNGPRLQRAQPRPDPAQTPPNPKVGESPAGGVKVGESPAGGVKVGGSPAGGVPVGQSPK